jgi:hypothetical protein
VCNDFSLHFRIPEHGFIRWKRTKGKQPRRREAFVVCSHQSWFSGLNYPHRERVTREAPKMAFSPRSVNESQHCAKGPSRRNINLVFPGGDVPRVDVVSFSPVDSWKTYVPSTFTLSIPWYSYLCSGFRQERPLVCYFSSLLPAPTQSFAVLG